jgi:hypothetical protein
MGHALLWVESLASALLLVAVVAAWTARRERRRWDLPVFVVLLLAVTAAALTWGLHSLYLRGALEASFYAAALAWTVGFLLGSTLILWRGLRQRGEAGEPPGRSWPPGRLALALAALVVVNWITFANMDLAVRLQLAALRAEEGARIQALVPPRVPDRNNAALVYQQAFEALTPLERLPPGQRDKWFGGPSLKAAITPGRPKRSLPFDPKDKDLGAFLDSQRRGLDLLRKAAALPDCWFEHNYADGFDMLQPELEHLRYSGSLLVLSALHRAATENDAGALQDVALVFRVARHIQDPIMISQLVAWSIERDGTLALEGVLASISPRAEDLAALSFDGEGRYRKTLQRVLQMEEAATASLMAAPSDLVSSFWVRETMDGGGRWIIASPVYRVFFLPSDLTSFRLNIRQFRRLVGRPYHEVREQVDAFQLSFKAHQGGILTRLLMPAFVKPLVAATTAEAHHGLRRLAVAVTAHRARTGKFPDRLDAVLSDRLVRVPTDPFDGKPLRLRREGADVLLYSIGPDLVDNGGTLWDPAKNEGDLVLRLRGK